MHTKTTEELFALLKTSDLGLSMREAADRLKTVGANALAKEKKKPLILSFLEEFTDLMVVILIFASILAALGGEPVDASVILFIVILNAVIGFMQKYKAEKALEALNRMLSPHAKVIRDGEMMQIAAKNIVPGDILILTEGDRVPADARIIKENELELDESALTGESLPVAKQIETIEKGKREETQWHRNTVFMGTAVTHGTGHAVVVETGMKTQFGKIAHLTQTTVKDKSPLQKELGRIGIFVGKITLAISAVLIVVGIVIQDKSFIDTFLFAVSVAVAAVPEGLPATITVALAIGVQRLAKQKAIVKKLASVETLGSTTVICSDKTGTLTKNQMTVREAYLDQTLIQINGTGYSPEGEWEVKNHLHAMQALCETAILCNNSKHEKKERKWTILGDPTEGALLVAAIKTAFNPKTTLENYKRLREIPFDSTRKMMTTIDQHHSTKKIRAHLKGAPDSVLKVCTNAFVKGKIVKLTPKLKKEIEAQNEQMASKALRVLAFAMKELKGKAQAETGMVFVGLMGMIDPPRTEVYDAVEKAHTAGIRIYVITGDYGATALAIARDLNIIRRKDARLITGEELERMNEKELSRLFKSKEKEILFARVSPEHKLKIVNALKQNGEIVAMTGDGVNDAPALKKSDIGVAMGITGTDVSKEAADMILVDDSFGTIVTAVEEGRTIYENLKKFVFYIFSCNIGELVTVFTAIILGIPAPLTAILILAVNLGTDVLPAIALGVDPPEPGIMNRPPRSPKAHLMTKAFIGHFIYLGLIIGGIVIGCFFWMLSRYGWQWGTPLADESTTYLKASSAAFALLVLIQMVNALNSRSLTHSLFKVGILSNQWLLRAIVISLLTAWAFVEVPFFQKFLHTTGLTLKEWSVLIAGSFLILIIEELRKVAFTPKSNNKIA